MAPAKSKIGKTRPVSASRRREVANETTQAGVKNSSSLLYKRKWEQFVAFCKDENIQEGSGTMDPNNSNEPSAGIAGKIVE